MIADFSGTPTTVVVGNTVAFTDLSSCSPTSWNWSFPGGSPASYSGQNPPAITYNTLGTYDVSLTVTKASGSDVKTATAYITVIAPEFNMQNGTVTTCMGNFYDTGGLTGSYSNNENITETFYPSTSGAMARFTFTSFSTESGYDYLYIYNGNSTAAPLIGTYNGTVGPGTVTATNASGALTFRFTSDVSVTSSGWVAAISCYSNTSPPVANFTADVLAPVIGQTVSFTDQSSNNPTSWNWSFSGPGNVTYVGGTTATSQNPQVQFDALGTYNASLIATNAYGSNSLTKTNYINVINCTYCTSNGNMDYQTSTTLVNFNSLNNATAKPAAYTDYTAQSTDISVGNAYNLTVNVNTDGYYTVHTFVWIDWNQNCSFTDAGEAYDLGTAVNVANGPTSASPYSIPVLAGATLGSTRMRVSTKYYSTPSSCETGFDGEVEDYTVNVAGGPFEVQLTALLEEPFNGTTMDALLGVQLPLAQPYFIAPWNYTGTESVASIPANVVDWVLVELRDAASAATATPATMMARQAAFILNDGSIVGMDGTSNLNFGVSITQNLYAVVWHRNHLSILSNNPLPFSGGIYTYNFTSGVNQVFGGLSGHKQLGTGIWGMMSGDGNKDGTISTFDKSPLWEDQSGNKGLLESDYNLDGESNNIDKDNYWEPNLGKGSQVPN